MHQILQWSLKLAAKLSSPTLWARPWGHTYNLRQVQRVISNSVENEILEPVDDVEQLLTQRSHVVGGCVCCSAPNGCGL